MWEMLKDILPSICTVVVAIISSRMVIISANKSVDRQKADKLQNDLEDFYYPFLLLSMKTTQLYRALHQVNKEDCDSCLVYLLSGKKFDGNALEIWKEIIANNIKLNELIIKYSTIINNKHLRDDLSNLSTHYTMLELANANFLIGNEDVLSDYTFPTKVIENIEIEIDKIVENIRDLSK